jgi:hypothetical protein
MTTTPVTTPTMERRAMLRELYVHTQKKKRVISKGGERKRDKEGVDVTCLVGNFRPNVNAPPGEIAIVIAFLCVYIYLYICVCVIWRDGNDE